MNALDNLSAHVARAMAVVCCIANSIPSGPGEMELRAANALADLVGAAEDILTLAQRDVEDLERQMRTG